MKTTVQFTASECRRRWVGARANLRSGLEPQDHWRKLMREVAAARMSIAARGTRAEESSSLERMVMETLAVANPQRVPKEIAVCPECGGGLWWQFTTEDWLCDMHLDCETEDECDQEIYAHRGWQSDWQPVIDRVRRWLAARLPNDEAQRLAANNQDV